MRGSRQSLEPDSVSALSRLALRSIGGLIAIKRRIGIIALVGVLIAGGAIVVPHLLGSGPGPHRYLNGIDVRDMVRDQEGTLWLATQKGLYRLPPAGRPSPVTGDEALRLPMSSIALEKSGRIWMGTDEGLVTRTPEGVERIERVMVSCRPQYGGESRTEYAIGPEHLMAASLFVLVPPLIVYFLAQRQLIEGIAAGAVKG